VQKPNGQFVLPVFITFRAMRPALCTSEYCQPRFNLTLAITVSSTVLICMSSRAGPRRDGFGMSVLPLKNGHSCVALQCPFRANRRHPELFNRLATLRDEQERREVIYAKNLPRNSPASCLRGMADDLWQPMRQNKKPLPRAGPIAGEPAD
jgi:hypothetical protein